MQGPHRKMVTHPVDRTGSPQDNGDPMQAEKPLGQTGPKTNPLDESWILPSMMVVPLNFIKHFDQMNFMKTSAVSS